MPVNSEVEFCHREDAVVADPVEVVGNGGVGVEVGAEGEFAVGVAAVLDHRVVVLEGEGEFAEVVGEGRAHAEHLIDVLEAVDGRQQT